MVVTVRSKPHFLPKGRSGAFLISLGRMEEWKNGKMEEWKIGRM